GPRAASGASFRRRSPVVAEPWSARDCCSASSSPFRLTFVKALVGRTQERQPRKLRVQLQTRSREIQMLALLHAPTLGATKPPAPGARLRSVYRSPISREAPRLPQLILT